MARKLRGEGVSLGDLFTFLSGLYFRGKIAYASVFGTPPKSCSGIYVITPARGLLTPETLITAADLRRFGATKIGEDVTAYMQPLSMDARHLAEAVGPETDVILLGSVATHKYLKVLLHWFGRRLKFPKEFVGRGDMSRGGLLLRCAVDRIELEYIPVEGAVLHGKKPPKMKPRQYPKTGAPGNEGNA